MENINPTNLENIVTLGYLALGVGLLALVQSAYVYYFEDEKEKTLVFLIGAFLLASQYVILPLYVKIFFTEDDVNLSNVSLNIWLFLMAFTGATILIFSLMSKYQKSVKQKMPEEQESER